MSYGSLGPNPFRRKLPPEEEKPPVTPVVEPEKLPEPHPAFREEDWRLWQGAERLKAEARDKEELLKMPFARIPAEGQSYTLEDEAGKSHELSIFEDYEFVGTEPTLRTLNYNVYEGKTKVGTLDFNTGKFIPEDPKWWQTALKWAFAPATITGMAIREMFVEPERPPEEKARIEEYQKELASLKARDLDREEYLKELRGLAGRYEDIQLTPMERERRATAEYETQPWWQQLLWELPFWAALSVSGLSALKGFRAARALPTAARIPAQVALAPVAGYEWAVGQVIAKTVGGTYNIIMRSVLRRNLHSWAKSAGVEIPKATEDAFINSAVASLKPQFMVKEAVKTLFKPTKAGYAISDAGAKAAETAAAQAVRTSPLLLGLTKGVPPKVPAVVPTAIVPKAPTVPPTVPAVPERVAMPIEVQREQITRGQAELDLLPPERLQPNSIIAIRSGFVGTDAQSKVALVIQVTQEGTELVAGNVVGREDVSKLVIGRLLKQAEPLLREAGIQVPIEGLSEQGARIAEKFAKPPAVTKPPVGEGLVPRVREEIAVELDEVAAEIEGLTSYLATEPARKLIDTIKKTGWYKGEVTNLTLKQYKLLTDKTPSPTSLTADKKHIKWEYALGDVATELGYPSGDALKEAIEKAGESNTRLADLKSQKAALTSELVGAVAEAPVIPKELPITPPPLSPEAVTLGRTESEWAGFMADLQDAQTVADVAFRNDIVRRWINLLPEIKGFFKAMNPSAIANTPAEQAMIIRAVLRDEGYQKSQGIISFLNELGGQGKIFGSVNEKGLIKSGILKGQTVGDIAEHRSKWEAKLTDEQKVWLDRAKVIEESIIEFLKKNNIDIALLRLEEGGQFATRRVWARTLNDGSVIDTAYVGAGPGRPGARLPTERHRVFKTELEAIEAGYRYLSYEEALYLKLSGAYNRVADKQMADWLLTKVTWRTTGAPEELKLSAEAAILKKRHSQKLVAALNRAVRGERVPDVTIRSIATSYPDQAQRLKDLIPRLQAGEPTAKEVQDLTRAAKGLFETNKSNALRAINARARARERALVTRMGEAIIPAPAFAGKILTGPEAKETARALRKAFDPSFSRFLAQANKANAVARFFMLAGDYSPFTIQLLFLIGENPVIYGKAFGGALRAMLNPEFHSKFLLKHKATIDKHPNLLITKAGATEFTEAMARGGWLSGKTALIPQAENYWKTLSLFLPRTVGKVGGTVLTPFQRVFEYSLDSAGIYMAEAYDYMCTTPARTADVDQFINEFRGLTSSARIGVSVLQRQIETGLILAPRYNRAIAGLLYDVGTGGIRGSLARKSLAKGIAAICAIAAVISIARGESEEEILDHYNPNSSNFFTWDVAGQKVGPGSKVRSVAKLFAQSVDNPDSLFQLSMDNPGLRFFRGNLSPVVSSGLDLITGRSYIGDPTRDGMLSFSKEIIGGNLLPIWVQTVLMEGGDVKGRTIRGIAEFFGGRSYPEPVWGEVSKLRDKYAKQDFNVRYEDLNRMQTDKLRNNHPDLKDLEDKAELEGAERGTEDEKWVYETREFITNQRDDALEKAAIALLSGLMSKYDYDKERGYARPYYSGGMSVLWLARESLDPYSIKQIEKWMGENQKPEDKVVDKYQEYRANLIQKADLPKDWDRINTQLEAYLAGYSKPVQDYVRVMVNRWINDLPPNAKNVELMRLRGIEDETWWDDYRGTAKPKAPTRRATRPSEPTTPSAPTTPSGGLGPNPFR